LFFCNYRSEVDIKGHDGVIYKGRIDVGKLPTVDMQKKNSVVVFAPPQSQRPRSDINLISAPHQSSVTIDEEHAIPREQTFT
jgi:hypothetical protein